MQESICCPNWDFNGIDLGHQGSFEFMLGRCSHCGAYWLNAFCTATNTTGYERICDEDARAMINMPPGAAQTAFVYKWFCEHQ